MGTSWLLKTILDYVVINITPGDYFTTHNIIIYIVFMIINGLFLSVLIPLVLKKNGILLKYEYLFLDDFIELQGKKYLSKRLFLIVVSSDEDVDEKIAEIEGKPYKKS